MVSPVMAADMLAPKLAFHPYANLFPLIEGQEFSDLADDIRHHGLRDRIALLVVDGSPQILDGRNRYRALVYIVTSGALLGQGWKDKAGHPLPSTTLDPQDSYVFTDYSVSSSGDPLAYVLSLNLSRRHLNESQRGMVAAQLSNLSHGGDRRSNQDANLHLETPAVSRAKAAGMLNVSQRTVHASAVVRRNAVPEIIEAVEQGKLGTSVAVEIASQPQERQAAIIAALPRDTEGKLTPDVKKALGPVIAEIRREKIEAKKERRAEREQQLGRKIQSLPDQMFGVAIEDFEWDHEAYSRDTGFLKHPSMHYETATDAHTPEEIAARCADRFACLAPDCILFKWVTIPHLAIGIKALELQGFRYVTHLVWNKERPGEARGTGYWFTGEHEVVLVGVRGKVVPPATAHFRSNFSAPIGEHSEKPANIHEIVEYHWPNVPKVEFNARAARPGWTSWGFDAPAVYRGPAIAGSMLNVEVVGDNEIIIDNLVSRETESVVQKDDSESAAHVSVEDRQENLPLDPPEQPAPVELEAEVDILAVFQCELPEAVLFEWQALHLLALDCDIPADASRHLIGEGFAVDDNDRSVLTSLGNQRLRSLRAYVERCERRHGRTLGYSRDINPPAQIDLDDVLRGAS